MRDVAVVQAEIGGLLAEMTGQNGYTVAQLREQPLGTLALQGGSSPFAPFALYTLRSWHDDFKQHKDRYPCGVPLLDYSGSPLAVWSLTGEGAAYTLSSLAGRLSNAPAPPSSYGVLSQLHRSELFPDWKAGTLQQMPLTTFAATVLYHLGRHIKNDHLPANALHPLHVFQFPVFAWRPADADGNSTGEKVPLCLPLATHVASDAPATAGDIRMWGGQGCVRYRSLCLGHSNGDKPLWMPVHMLVLLLVEGPWKLDPALAALKASDPERLGGKTVRQIYKMGIETLHCGACQTPATSHCISRRCLAYGCKARNHEQAVQYVRSCRGKRGPDGKFRASVYGVFDASKLVNKWGKEQRNAWLQKERGSSGAGSRQYPTEAARRKLRDLWLERKRMLLQQLREDMAASEQARAREARTAAALFAGTAFQPPTMAPPLVGAAAQALLSLSQGVESPAVAAEVLASLRASADV